VQKKQESSENQEKLKHDLALLEAALYVAGRPLDSTTLGRLLKTRSKKKITKLAKTLIDSYQNRNTSLEILELTDERFVLQLKAEFTPRVRRLATRPLLSSGPLKTLSYIAYRQRVPQSQVIRVRGSHAYNHLNQLENLDLIVRERVGRKKVIRTTEFFADFFGLSHDMRAMKTQLKNIFEDFAKPELNQKTVTA
jgi:segregation and condensation protein B